MKLYRFSPIRDRAGLFEAFTHIHTEGYTLCKQSFGMYLPNAGNMGVFCHYNDEYALLTEIRKQLTEASDNYNQKYFRLHEPIVIPSSGEIPAATYTHLYIRRPDPYRHHVGDLDFYVELERYQEIKNAIQSGNGIKGARVFDRVDLDMIELYHPDIDVLAYVSTHTMTETVRVKQSEVTNL